MCHRIAVLVLGLLVLSPTTWAAEAGKWRGKAVLVSTEFNSTTVVDKEGHELMLGEDNGMVFAEDGEAFLDNAQYRVQWILDTGGMVAGGYKTFTAADGGQVFEKFSITKFTDTGVEGTWEFTGGTGKYDGIAGSGDFTVTNVSDSVYSDLLEGEYSIP